MYSGCAYIERIFCFLNWRLTVGPPAAEIMFSLKRRLISAGRSVDWRALRRRSTGRAVGNDINVSKIRNVTCIGINRPDKKNCLTVDIVEGLDEAITNLENDSTSKVGVVYGVRGNFCYGYDVDDITENPRLMEKIEQIGLLDRYCKKPLVAAVNGYCVGAGFDLALWCDFRIVEETAVLGRYARQYGMPLSERGAQRLVSILGLNKSLDWLLTGRIVKAKEAYETGLANRLVACGAGIGQAISFGCALANMPESCMKSDRAAIHCQSFKYSRETRLEIRKCFEEMRKIASEEVCRGAHLTRTGDVRLRT